LLFEAEGGKPRPPKRGESFGALMTVSQKLSRRDIVDKLCNELKGAGFRSAVYVSMGMAECFLTRVEEQKCFIERTKPYYLSQETKNWADQYLAEIERRTKARARPRFPFECPL